MNYKRTKNGTLDMRFKINRQFLNNLPKGECLVCNESLKGEGRVRLDCGHNYCINCFVEHMRIDNRCGICRRVKCPKIKKKEITLELASNFITETILDLYQDESVDDNIDIVLSNYGLELIDKTNKWYNK